MTARVADNIRSTWAWLRASLLTVPSRRYEQLTLCSHEWSWLWCRTSPSDRPLVLRMPVSLTSC